MTVDAKLEIQSGRASRGYPNGSEGRATLDVERLFRPRCPSDFRRD